MKLLRTFTLLRLTCYVDFGKPALPDSECGWLLTLSDRLGAPIVIAWAGAIGEP